MALLITACTNRKRIAPAEGMRASALSPGSLASVSRAWTARVGKVAAVTPAWRLYCGRSFLEASDAARKLGGGLTIVSAGLGFVRGETPIPSYSLTVASGGQDSVLDCITPRANPKEWWARVSRLSPLCHTVACEVSSAGGLVVVALPERYLEMVSDDLANLPKAARSRLRIFTGAPWERIDQRLRSWVMPYDDRLDGPDSPLPGTRSDFAPRAARHFVETILTDAPKASADVHAKRIRTLLTKWRVPTLTSRPRKTDAELLALIRGHWEATGGRSGQLLRVLRDEAGVACEQGRLARLAKQIRNERRTT